MVEVRKGVDVAPLRVEPDPKKQLPTVTWSTSIPVHLSMNASPLAIGDSPPNHVSVSIAPDHEKVILVDDNGACAICAVWKIKLSSTCDNLWLFLSNSKLSTHFSPFLHLPVAGMGCGFHPR